MSYPLAIILRPLPFGWAVCLTDGRELARFRGPGAHARALRFVRRQLAAGVSALRRRS